MKKLFLFFIVMFMTFILFSCQKDEVRLFHLSAGDTVETVKSRIFLKSSIDDNEITWTSSDESVISLTGLVTRPEVDEEPVIVELIANYKSKAYIYQLTVLPKTGNLILDLYPSLDDEESIIEIIAYEELLILLETKSQALIYLGFESCPWCMEYLPIFHKLAKNTGHEVIYYYNFKDVRTVIDNQLNPDFQAIIDLINPTFLSKNPTNDELWWLFAPTFIGLKDGEIKGLFTGALDGHVAYENYLTKTQEEDLKDIFRNILSAVKPEDPCGC